MQKLKIPSCLVYQVTSSKKKGMNVTNRVPVGLLIIEYVNE